MSKQLSNIVIQALRDAASTPEIIVRELHDMAEGSGDYQRLRDVSPWAKIVWYAAADLIERHALTCKRERS